MAVSIDLFEMISLIKNALSSGSTSTSGSNIPVASKAKTVITAEPLEKAVEAEEKLQLSAEVDEDLREWQETVFDLIRTIKDPEKPETLEELDVVQEDLVVVNKKPSYYVVKVEFVPTVPHCSLATLIGLCLRTKLDRELPAAQFKVDLAVREGSHSTAAEVTKQINDKERVAAALENPNLKETVERCIAEPE